MNTPDLRIRPATGAAAVARPLFAQPAPRPVATLVLQDQTTPIQSVGYFFLLIFLFLLFSRVCDLFLSGLHLPLAASALALTSGVLGGRLLGTLTHKTSRYLLALSAWFTLSIPFGYYRSGSIEVIMDGWYKSLLAYFVIVSLISTYKRAARAFRVIVVGLFILAVLALTFGIEELGRLEMPAGHYTNPNDLGGAMLTGVLVWWAMAHNPQSAKWKRFIFVLAMLPILYAMLRTGSRAALIGVIGAAIFMFFNYSLFGKIKFLAVVGVAAFISIAILPDALAKRFVTFFQSETAYEDIMQGHAVGSANARMTLLKNSFVMTIMNPVFGVGPGNFINVDAKNSELAGRRGAWSGTHNTYTEVSSEAGIPAFIFFMAVLVTCWRELSSTRRLNASLPAHPRSKEIDSLCFGLKTCMVGYMVQFFFIHMAYTPLFTTLIGIIVAVTQTAKVEIAAYAEKAANPSRL